MEVISICAFAISLAINFQKFLLSRLCTFRFIYFYMLFTSNNRYDMIWKYLILLLWFTKQRIWNSKILEFYIRNLDDQMQLQDFHLLRLFSRWTIKRNNGLLSQRLSTICPKSLPIATLGFYLINVTCNSIQLESATNLLGCVWSS